MHTYCRTVGVFSLLFIHCDKGGHGDDGLVLGTGASVTHAVGVGGGEIELEGTTLDIPAGALAKDVDITLTSTTEAAPEGYANLSPVFRFEPAGLTFLVPVSARFTLEHTSTRGTTVFWSNSSETAVQNVGGTLDDESRTTTASITHFSLGFAGVGDPLVPPPDSGVTPDAEVGPGPDATARADASVEPDTTAIPEADATIAPDAVGAPDAAMGEADAGMAEAADGAAADDAAGAAADGGASADAAEASDAAPDAATPDAT